MKKFLRLRRCQAGAAAIEFAIISMVMILVCLGIIELGRGLYVRNDLSYAADLAARKILTNSGVTDNELEDEVRSGFRAGDSNLLHVTFGTETVDGVTFRTVAMSYPFTLLIPGLANEAVSLTLDRRIPLV